MHRKFLVGHLKMTEDDRRAITNLAFRQVCARLGVTGSTPVIELVAIRILELASTGESDADRLIEATVATFSDKRSH
jgi:hypothetical protein